MSFRQMLPLLPAKERRLDYVLLGLYVLVNYWPVAFCVFALKNDATRINLPPKLFFSDWLHQGIVPLWNPYLHGGFPIYADPGFAFWNPITWIFGMVGYNAYSFHLETIVFIVIGATGFYRLGKVLGCGRLGSLLMGILYSSSGFVAGSLEFTNYLPAGGFFPWCLCFLILVLRDSTRLHVWSLSVAIYLFVTSGHPAIPLSGVYYLVLTAIVIFYLHPHDRSYQNLKRVISRLLAAVGLAAVFLLPYLYSLVEVLPHYQRTISAVNQGWVSEISSEGFPFIITSLIHPFIPIGDEITKSVLYRNSFVSFLGFLLFAATFKSNKLSYRPFIILATISLIFLLPGRLAIIPAGIFPGLGFVQHMFPMRLFLCSNMIILVGLSVNTFNTSCSLYVSRFLSGVQLIPAYLPLFVIFSGVGWCVYYFSHLPVRNFTFTGFYNFPLSIVISLIYAAVIILIIKKFRGNSNIIVLAIATEALLLSWVALPINGISKTSVARLQAIIETTGNRRGYPTLLPVDSVLRVPPETELYLGDWSYYRPAVVADQFKYPSAISAVKQQSSFITEKFRGKPFVMLGDGTNELKMQVLTPNSLGISVSLKKPDTLFIWQNWYPGWHMHLGENKVLSAPGSKLAFPIDSVGNLSIVVHFGKNILIVLSLVSFGFFAISRYFCSPKLKEINQSPQDY